VEYRSKIINKIIIVIGCDCRRSTVGEHNQWVGEEGNGRVMGNEYV
jgi:hypothetical protein